MKKTKILVVDDEVLIAQDIANCLQELGYEVCACVSTAEDAIKIAGTEHPQPYFNGY